MRATARATLGSVCNVISTEWLRDDRGNLIEAVVTGPDFACQLGAGDYGTSQEASVAGIVATVPAYHVLVPWEAEVSEQDRLIVTTEGETTLYEVVGQTGRMTYLPLQRISVKDVPG